MTNLYCTVLLCVCFLSTVLPQGTAGGTIFEKEVVDKLLENYSTDARPGKPPLDITTIYIDVVLAQIQQLDAVEQVLTSNLWVRQSWNDDHLTWNPEENGNVTAVYVNSENIWRPDTILYNRIHDEGFSSTPDTNAIIKYNGDVFWPYPVTARTSCLLDISLFPYDVQRCPLEFGSWTYNAEQLALVNVSPEGDTEEFIENGERVVLTLIKDSLYKL
ncbi:neuronal acetylcholine receptor subunit alpha-9-II-like [Branchiostoma floridae]|uniref:Neuronal acetylcholine receptor subunit alpha-9-II-like n=1 Tax=Branchiostoma floridae TaxID=7739 RepID=A0A9J7HIZ2_BRAFL|nr:neuronal acetylcholine receptor subunit alpha-9-II-like [Branchiostoma floridae]